jgi:hypothetical protein
VADATHQAAKSVQIAYYRDVMRRQAILLMAVCACMAASTITAAAAAPTLSNRTFRLGSIYIITGHTGVRAGTTTHIRGPVILRGSWNGGPYRLMRKTTSKLPAGSYKLIVRPNRRGVLRLWLQTPDPATYHVSLTVI